MSTTTLTDLGTEQLRWVAPADFCGPYQDCKPLLDFLTELAEDFNNAPDNRGRGRIEVSGEPAEPLSLHGPARLTISVRVMAKEYGAAQRVRHEFLHRYNINWKLA